MSAGLDSVYKILKDETRRKIVLLLNEKGSVNYTDLMVALGISSTGTLNYHLKILGELLTKNGGGQYVLTEKGKLASRLLLEFPEEDNQLREKRKWWRRYWLVAIVVPSVVLAVGLAAYFLGDMNEVALARSLIAFVGSIVFTYFFYRMIRPPSPKSAEKNPTRTVKKVFVSGRNLFGVKAEVQSWVRDEDITVEVERDDFIRGRLGVPSGLGWTAPKYFEVSLKPEQTGVMVHTEGWISLYDVSERSFSKSALVVGGTSRKKGWDVIERLWERLQTMSK